MDKMNEFLAAHPDATRCNRGGRDLLCGFYLDDDAGVMSARVFSEMAHARRCGDPEMRAVNGGLQTSALYIVRRKKIRFVNAR